MLTLWRSFKVVRVAVSSYCTCTCIALFLCYSTCNCCLVSWLQDMYLYCPVSCFVATVPLLVHAFFPFTYCTCACIAFFLCYSTYRALPWFLFLSILDQQISITLQTELMAAFQRFTDKTLRLIGLDPALGQLPVKVSTIDSVWLLSVQCTRLLISHLAIMIIVCPQFEKPIYGKLKPSFTDFMAPGIIIRYCGCCAMISQDTDRSGCLQW